MHPYLKPYMGTVAAPQVPPAAPPTTPDTIRNTPELRECIKDAMLREGVASAADLNRLIGYDSVHTLERLLSGKLNWFPDILSAVAEALGIDHDSLPISPAERMQLLPAGYFGDGAMLVRPIPVVSWANAAGHSTCWRIPIRCLFSRWDPENTETVPAPVGTRKGTQAFRVTGISMEPTIMDDDIILVEQRMSLDEVPNNKIVVARLTEGKFEDCVVCKRLRRQGGHCWLTQRQSRRHGDPRGALRPPMARYRRAQAERTVIPDLLRRKDHESGQAGDVPLFHDAVDSGGARIFRLEFHDHELLHFPFDFGIAEYILFHALAVFAPTGPEVHQHRLVLFAGGGQAGFEPGDFRFRRILAGSSV